MKICSPFLLFGSSCAGHDMVVTFLEKRMEGFVRSLDFFWKAETRYLFDSLEMYCQCCSTF